MIRLGLCCQFRDQPIKFRTVTATTLARRKRAEALEKLSELCLSNAEALLAALRFCADHGIGSFRITSQILPLRTHPQHGYELEELPAAAEIVRRFGQSRHFARKHGLRTCFHPDQFVVLNSQRPDVVDSSLRELEYQAEVAEWVGADVINIHAGGAFGDKATALDAFRRNVEKLSARTRKRLTVENDDRIYTPADLLPVCRSLAIPLVYDVHHHRCNRDQLSLEKATEQALTAWDREPLFHISSPCEGWKGAKPERHHEFIDVNDFPNFWLTEFAGLARNLTVEVEARAKEKAVLKLAEELRVLGASLGS